MKTVSTPTTKLNLEIPAEVSWVTNTLNKANYEAFLVGGCVRDLLLGRTPKDWDVTTNATPDQIIALFPKTFYENTYGTVGVVNEDPNVPKNLSVVEVTPYRVESEYNDGRHPESVTFSDDILDDLKRRDFTINAIAYDPIKGQIVDPYKGQEDLADKTLRAVGEAGHRFREDGLRIIRAVRIATELGFMINIDTEKALEKELSVFKKVSQERIRDEFVKMLMSDSPMIGVIMLQKLGILSIFLPELEEGLHMKQTQAHSYVVFEHLLRSLQHAADKKWPFDIRLAALLHDIGKPRTMRKTDSGEVTFYGHDVVGAKMTKVILERMRFSKDLVETIVKLVRWHMFFSDTDQITPSAVRRMIVNVGEANIWKLMDLRACDRIGTGRPKANPYRLRKYQALIEEVTRDPISVAMLHMKGTDLVKILNTEPGPKIGLMLNALLEEVLEDPTLNTFEKLSEIALKFDELDLKDLRAKAQAGNVTRERLENEHIEEINKKYGLK